MRHFRFMTTGVDSEMLDRKRRNLDRYRTVLIDYEQRTFLDYRILNQNQRIYGGMKIVRTIGSNLFYDS